MGRNLKKKRDALVVVVGFLSRSPMRWSANQTEQEREVWCEGSSPAPRCGGAPTRQSRRGRCDVRVFQSTERQPGREDGWGRDGW